MVCRFAFLGRGPIAEACLASLCGCVERGDCCLPLVVGDERLLELLDARLPATVARLPAHERRDAEILASLAAEEISHLISVQYSWILPAPLLDAAKGGAFNLHNAKLPDYRGHNALSHEILNGETQHTVSIHWMQPRVDTGFLAFSRIVPIDADETARSLYDKALPAAVAAFRDLVDHLIRGWAVPREPIRDGGRFYRRNDILPLKCVPAGADAETMDRVARAFHFPPHEPAYLEHQGRRLYLVPQERQRP